MTPLRHRWIVWWRAWSTVQDRGIRHLTTTWRVWTAVGRGREFKA